MEKTLERTIGQIVLDDFRSAAVFEKFGINLCRNGDRNIEEACEEKKVNGGKLRAKLKKALAVDLVKTRDDYSTWSLKLLTNHIEDNHHQYMAEQIPVLKTYLNEICEQHAIKHPELNQLQADFSAGAVELTRHIANEKRTLFPYIRRMMQAKQQKEKLEELQLRKVEYSMETLMHEHEKEVACFRSIEILSNGYTAPEDACVKYKLTFSMLKAFQSKLNLQIHLEKNFLFPKAEALENKLNNSNKKTLATTAHIKQNKMLTIYNSYLSEFKSKRIGYGTLGLFAQSCFGGIAAMVILANYNATTLPIVELLIVTVFAMCYNAAFMINLKAKIVFNLLITSVVFSCLMIVVNLL